MSEAKTADVLAAEYCDQPRCAQVTRDDKAWHRMHAAWLSGHAAGLEVAEALATACSELSKADDRRETLGIYVVRIEAALAAFRKAGK